MSNRKLIVLDSVPERNGDTKGIGRRDGGGRKLTLLISRNVRGDPGRLWIGRCWQKTDTATFPGNTLAWMRLISMSERTSFPY